MSYRVIIADDEPKLLQLIKILGHWEQYDIEIVDECRDGLQTLESIRRHRPDFVLSDIKMPGLDGIELIEETRKAGIDSLFILISGYRHFEYARSAIALNVVDYLLKPVDEEKLNKTLEKVCRQLDQMYMDQKEREELCRLKESQQQSRMEQFWKDLLWTRTEEMRPDIVTEERCNAVYQTEFMPGCYQIICLITNINGILEHANSLFSDEMILFMRSCFGKWARYYFHQNLCGYAIVLNFAPGYQKQIREGISALYYNVRNLKEIYGNFRLNIGVSTVKDRCSQLPAAFLEARAAEWGRLVMMRDGVLDYGQISRFPSIRAQEFLSAEEQERLRGCIKYLRKEELGNLFSELYQRAAACANSSPEDMAELFFCIMNTVESSVPETETKRMSDNCYYACIEAKTFPLLIKNLYLRLETYVQEEQKKLNQRVGKPIREAVRYIRANYAKALSAEEVAGVSHVSTSYLGKLFKEELDMGFNEFLTQVRLEEAEKLLAGTKLSIKEIAGAVGYPDEKYFSRLFKKTTGIKPTEYRKIYG